jgi:replicative DNA helicase
VTDRAEADFLLTTQKFGPLVEAAISDSRLPYSEETERAVLGSIMLEPLLIEEVAAQLRPSNFHLERHRLIFKTMLDLHGENPPAPIDNRTLQAKLEREGKFDEAGGMGYLATMDLDLPDIGRIDAYIKIVRDLSIKRSLVQVSNHLGVMARNGVSPSEAVAVIIEDLEDIQNNGGGTGWITLNDVQDVVTVKLETNGYAGASLPTGLPDLDRLIDGLPVGKLTYIAARPGCGKSALLSQIVEYNACRADSRVRVPCGFVTLEMTNEEMILRMISRRTGIPFKRLLKGDFRGDDWQTIHRAQQSIRDASIWFEETVLSVSEVISAARKLRRKHDIQLLAIDYLGLMPTDDLATKENRTNQIAEISRRLAAFAKGEGIAVAIAYQLNRGSVERADQRPNLHHLAESGAPERDASQVHMIWQETDKRGTMTGNCEILVRKNRNGETGVVECLFDGPRMLFTCKENRREL